MDVRLNVVAPSWQESEDSTLTKIEKKMEKKFFGDKRRGRKRVFSWMMKRQNETLSAYSENVLRKTFDQNCC
jgi:hypothetical protein